MSWLLSGAHGLFRVWLCCALTRSTACPSPYPCCDQGGPPGDAKVAEGTLLSWRGRGRTHGTVVIHCTMQPTEASKAWATLRGDVVTRICVWCVQDAPFNIVRDPALVPILVEMGADIDHVGSVRTRPRTVQITDGFWGVNIDWSSI